MVLFNGRNAKTNVAKRNHKDTFALFTDSFRPSAYKLFPTLAAPASFGSFKRSITKNIASQ
ncbi:MAG: hypothetical protein BGO21_18480 [Dyadobacter sp. 50-39]|nr:MAG: hypothetical protein BGO21_18480 [Dyadobacter sp. 50-39]